MTEHAEVQFVAARAWLALHSEAWQVEFALHEATGEVYVWARDRQWPVYVFLDHDVWVSSIGGRYRYLHRALLALLTAQTSSLSGAQWHFEQFGRPCWSGCPC